MWGTLRFYSVVTVTGAVVMALEILSARILAPTFGNSVYVWGSIISVFLAALSVGYILGGRLADVSPTLPTVGRPLLFAAVFQAILLASARPLTEAIGELTDGSRYGPLLASTVLFAPPTILLATVSPFAVRLAAREVTAMGNVAGRLYALSTAGSLVGTLGATFLLIPYLELDWILALLLLTTAATAATAVFEAPRSNLAPLAMAAGLSVFAVLTPLRQHEDSTRVVSRMTPYQTIEVTESAGRRVLLSDGKSQSAVELTTGRPALVYPRYAIAALLFNDGIERAVVLGLGGGTSGPYLQEALPQLAIDFVELDPAMPEIAERYMGFERSPTRRIHIDDGRRFLAASNEQWDLIFCDTYLGLSVPFHLTTEEFYRIAQERLAPGGVLMVNFAAGMQHPFTRSLYVTINRVFRHTYVFDVPMTSNVVLIGTNDFLRLTPEMLADRAAALDARFDYQPSFADVAERLVPLDLELEEDMVLRDSFAPIDRLLHLDAPLGD